MNKRKQTNVIVKEQCIFYIIQYIFSQRKLYDSNKVSTDCVNAIAA